jgi:hypothetical protein
MRRHSDGPGDCAGTCKPALLADMSIAARHETVEMNITGSSLTACAVATRLQRASLTGSIVTSSQRRRF